MKKIFKILLVLVLTFAALGILAAGAFVLLIGPWPVYKTSNYQNARYFKQALASITEAAAKVPAAGARASLLAGWAEREITPEPGHPMAGYGGRPNNLRSTGVHEPLFVRALALRSGDETVVLLGADMLQTFPNLLEEVENRIRPKTGLTNRNLYYSASHTHCGPGGLAPGLVPATFMGAYDHDYLIFLADQFAGAVIEASNALAPARFGHGATDVPAYILNRSRHGGPVDSRLNVACVERMEDGQRCYIARYSAHCTNYSEEMLKFNNDYAGAFQRAVKEQTGMPLLFMAGAVGAMRPNPPGPPLPKPWTKGLELGFENDLEATLVRQGKKTLEAMLHDQELRVEAMGQSLAQELTRVVEAMTFEEQVRLASLVLDYAPPPAQVRPLSPKWRLSPFLFNLLGIPKQGRMQAVAVGSLVFIGMPHDFGGETSLKWQHYAASRDVNLCVTSFSGAYLGYLSPDQYYWNMGEHLPYNHNYEIGQMSWFGPDQEAFVTDLFQKIMVAIYPEAS